MKAKKALSMNRWPGDPEVGDPGQEEHGRRSEPEHLAAPSNRPCRPVPLLRCRCHVLGTVPATDTSVG